MVVLQRPKYAYFEGKVRPWEEAVLHVGSEAVYRGINVFEGLKAYWQPDGSMGIVAMRRHFHRLQQSAKLLHVPFEHTFEQFDDAVHSIIKALCVPDQDIWIRATVFLVEGHWGEDQRSDLVLTAYLTPQTTPKPIKLGISSWRRATDLMLPARIKTASNYQPARLARIEGRARGCSEMILLNTYDRVAEAGGSCVLMVRDGVVITPPHSEGSLESITVDLIEALAKDLSIPFVRRPVDRTELYIADELALAGTLAELTPVASCEDSVVTPKLNLLKQLSDRYFDAVRGHDPHPSVELSKRMYRKPARQEAELAAR